MLNKVIEKIVLCFFVVFMCSNAISEINKSEFTDKEKKEVKYSEFKKDGVLYRSYDFGKAIFTVDSPSLINSSGTSVEMYWFWPGMIPWSGNSGDDMSDFSVVRIWVNFSGFGRYRDTYINWQETQKRTDFYRPTEVSSDVEGLRKFTAKSKNIMYMPKDEGIKTPQGTPLVFWCYHEKLPTPRLTCEMVFHYYDQVALHTEFNGDVILPHWKEFVDYMDNFFKSRFEDK